MRVGEEGGREVNHIISSKREKCLDNKSWKPQDSCSGVFFPGYWIGVHGFWRKWDTFSSAYLFQDGFSLWRLVSKTAQEELGQLDREIGEEGEVSYNIRGDALRNKKSQIKEAATRLKTPQSFSESSFGLFVLSFSRRVAWLWLLFSSRDTINWLRGRARATEK